MKLKTLLLTLFTLSFLLFIAYRIKSNSQAKGDNKQSNPSKSVQTLNGFVAKEDDFSNIIAVSGSIEANEQVEIRSEVSGIVENINFKEGSFVTKGQTLFKVNDIELRAQLAQAITKRNLASENERRAKLLLEKEAISQEEYDIASAEYRSSQSQTQLIQAQIAKTIVKAPFSGKIGLRNISPGTYLTPTTVVTNLVSANEVKITFSIPEKYAHEVSVNKQIDFTVSGSSENYKAIIYAIEPAIDVATRTLLVRAKADNKQNKLFPGTYANVKLPLNEIKNALLIPTEAVIPIQNGKKVFVKENGKAKEVQIETGTRTEKSILVTSGLKIGDTIITSGIMSLKPDTPINVKLVN
ncbi:Efflux transporter periplasmic adaptor subunit [Flavobacterium sp. 9AF]|uniref:efflux RND transporter periplasmic adaptor subunit n=1 Tax=Flavobacterium sp. 9AF TaxID=2653142 RepID=UPI0012F2B8C1|nr:efflux RND transporter periplasmic adaptor subunit [Flavobacterium sp. 9AF]VXC33667.1 Efflux transporter periplasmic adaptor subunit [Flavobacterium sp. 9AF]